MAFLYSLGDRVSLGPARGSWEGYILQRLGGPSPQYTVQSPNWGDLTEGTQIVAESDIASGPLSAPTFTVGQLVTLSGAGGVIVADNADATYTMEIEVPHLHYTLTRTHVVPAWRLAIENT